MNTLSQNAQQILTALRESGPLNLTDLENLSGVTNHNDFVNALTLLSTFGDIERDTKGLWFAMKV